MSCYINALGALCALGNDINTIRNNLFIAHSPGMFATDKYSPGKQLMLGQIVDANLPDLQHLPRELNSRNNALLLAALQQIRPQFEKLSTGIAKHRIAVILGTSTSGISQSEDAIQQKINSGSFPNDFHVGQQELGSSAQLIAQELSICGAAYCISTACSSGAKAIASAARLIENNLADLVIVGGADSLSRFTVAGFSSISAVSEQLCLPSSLNRKGINIGEAAVLMLLSRTPGSVRIAGWGESSDAHHISAPAPDGSGARSAISKALQKAKLNAADIGYINLHGTSTIQNDAMENKSVADLLPQVSASSTKPLSGHCLGTAGSLEALFCYLTLTDTQQRLPPHLWDGVQDPNLPVLPLVQTGQKQAVNATISNSFAFGGNNISLVLAK